MRRKRTEEPRCANGINCVAYPALGEPAKLSRSNPGRVCFACEERSTASALKKAAANEKAVERRDVNNRPWAKSKNWQPEPTEVERAREVLERRRRSVITCERELRSALASGDERLVRRWSRSLREAEQRMSWAEADLARAEKRMWSGHAS